MLDRAAHVDEQFIEKVKNNCLPPPFSRLKSSMLNAGDALQLFDSQVKSRLLDIVARRLKERGDAFYTIGSSGHEGNAVFGHIFPVTDMAFLHYRSGAFFIERAKQLKDNDGVEAILQSLCASSEDKISAGRHKVFGSVPLNIPPQTSTIASHLPKAMGAALSLQRAKALQLDTPLNDDSLILCSFGDASLNHAATQTTLNACSWLRHNQYPVPIIFICEDNGIGISVKTPKDWVKASVQDRVGIRYIEANGLDIIDTFNAANQAAHFARKGEAVFLHMQCVRLLGHAGSDIESQYLSQQEIEKTESADPLLYTASLLLQESIMSQQALLDFYNTQKKNIMDKAEEVIQLPKLDSKEKVMRAILPNKKKVVSYLPVSEAKREETFKDKFKQLSLKRTLQQQINFALTDILLQYPNTLLFGEDVAKKGGVYRVTADLQKQFGAQRVFDTILDETTILGTAIGFAHNGFIPIAEIQFLAYLHNAEDQLRGEAATLSFFSDGQYQNPMVIRIASLAYQKGFGGHFHNDNSIAVLRDLPGVIIACPSNGCDAAKLLRQCVKLAHEKGRVVVFLEPIALYMTKDLHKEGDEKWLSIYPSLKETIELDTVNSYGSGDTVILSYANGYYLSRKAQAILEAVHGIQCKVVDLLWLKPLAMEAIKKEIKGAKRVLVVDEGRKTGSISEEIITRLVEEYEPLPVLKRITGEDSFIPLGNAWQYVLPSCDGIVEAVLKLANKKENARAK